MICYVGQCGKALQKKYQSLQLHHNERDGVSNYRRLDYLLNRLVQIKESIKVLRHLPLLRQSTGHRWNTLIYMASNTENVSIL